MGVLAIGKKAITSVVKGKWRNALVYTVMGFNMLWKSNEVVKARKLSKNVELRNYEP